MAEIEEFIRRVVRSEVREALADIGTDDLFSQDVRDSMIREAGRLAEFKAGRLLKDVLRERHRQISEQLENEIGILMRTQADQLVKERLKHHLMVAAQQETGAVCARMEARLKEAMRRWADGVIRDRERREELSDNWGRPK